MEVIIKCKCGEEIGYEPGVKRVRCRICKLEYVAVPKMFSDDPNPTEAQILRVTPDSPAAS